MNDCLIVSDCYIRTRVCCCNASEFHLDMIFSGRRRREEKEWEVSK